MNGTASSVVEKINLPELSQQFPSKSPIRTKSVAVHWTIERKALSIPS